MKRWERWSFNALNAVVALTGLAYFSMKYLLTTDDPFAVVNHRHLALGDGRSLVAVDEFAVVNHPWEPTMLALHVVTAPVLVLLFGIVLRSHILKKLVSKYQPDRRTGWISLLSFAAMALSGYLLQVASTPFWLNVLLVLHLVTSGIFLIGYLAHLVIGWRLVRTPSAARSDAALPSTAQLPL